MITEESGDWTFNGSSTREYTHVYHDYPARMIPQIARKLINNYGNNSKVLFDPYCGTGSSLVEGMLSGLNVVGTDLNPLARLIATAKTDYMINPELIKKHVASLTEQIYNPKISPFIPTIRNMSYWFMPEVIPKLGRIRNYIESIQNKRVKQFFQVAFSETVRESSNTRKGEFKLFRYNEKQLKKHAPEPYEIMFSKLERNLRGLLQFKNLIQKTGKFPTTKVLDLNSVNQIPSRSIKKDSVDIVVTSPPYGDSHTTVAYGQYSRLSSEWLSLITTENIDGKLMGGTKTKALIDFPSDVLNKSIRLIYETNPSRALEVAAFYVDLLGSIKNVAKLLKAGGHVCYVVGNRTVGGIILPTSDVVRDFFESANLSYVTTHLRKIPNKRMPARNSPSNVTGVTSSTMLNEHIVVMKKK